MLKNKQARSKAADAKTPLGRHFFIIYTALITLAIALVVMGAYALYLRDTIDNNNMVTTRQLIRGAVYDLYTPTTLNAQEKKQYVHEANVRFPASEHRYEQFRYLYVPASENFKASIELTTVHAIDAAYGQLMADEKLFDNVAQFQRCSRLFIVQFEPGVDVGYSFKDIGSVKLADGRTAYLYKNSTCDTVYEDMRVRTADTETILRQIQSF